MFGRVVMEKLAGEDPRHQQAAQRIVGSESSGIGSPSAKAVCMMAVRCFSAAGPCSSMPMTNLSRSRRKATALSNSLLILLSRLQHGADDGRFFRRVLEQRVALSRSSASIPPEPARHCAPIHRCSSAGSPSREAARAAAAIVVHHARGSAGLARHAAILREVMIAVAGRTETGRAATTPSRTSTRPMPVARRRHLRRFCQRLNIGPSARFWRYVGVKTKQAGTAVQWSGDVASVDQK